MSGQADQVDPYRPFRPITGAWVARCSAIATIVVFGLVAWLAPGYDSSSSGMDTLNRVFIVGFGAVLAGFLWRYALIKAVPSRSGLLVVNIVQRHQLDWAQVAAVGFSDGSPWVVLELTDTEEVAVMAIQRADGRRADREAARLAALVQHHQRS